MTIRLEDIRFTAYHGVYPQEREHGNTFLVSVSLTLPEVQGVTTDDLSDTVDYQAVYQLVAQEMAVPSCLLEHVAGRVRQVLQQYAPKAEVHVQIKKKQPPVGGEVAWATVEI